MKNILLIALALCSFGVSAQTGAKATFEKKGQIFRDIKEGETLEFYYYFTNTGNSNLKISHVHPTCGCTVAEWPKYEIKPGQRDSLFVSFNTEGRPGYNAKGVNLETNGGAVNLVFEAYVIPKPGTNPFKEEETK